MQKGAPRSAFLLGPTEWDRSLREAPFKASSVPLVPAAAFSVTGFFGQSAAAVRNLWGLWATAHAREVSTRCGRAVSGAMAICYRSGFSRRPCGFEAAKWAF